MIGLAVQAVDEKRLAAFSVAWHHLVLGLRTATQPRNFHRILGVKQRKLYGYIRCISVLDIISQYDCKSMSRPGGYTLFQGLDYRTCFCIRGIKRKDIIDYQTSLTSSSRTTRRPRTISKNDQENGTES